MKRPSHIRSFHERLVGKKVSALELTEGYLRAIEQKDKAIGAFLSVFTERAQKAAQAIDKRIAAGESINLMGGIPYALKDNMLVAGEPATAASRILESYVAAYDATVVERLQAVGAVCVGKTNLDEFAMGASTEHSALRKTVNPRDKSKVPGGSSGGSAAAVAAGLVPLALGSDTGGSIRQPAAFCGVVGFKPTYGRVSRFGLMALASSFDQIGPLATTVEDAAILTAAVAGEDPYDATSLPDSWRYRPGDFTDDALAKKVRGLRIGLPREFFPADLNKDVRAAVEAAVRVLEKHGALVEKVSLPLSAFALAAYYVIMPAEASSNLARYDGMRYGLSKVGESPYALYTATRGAGFGREPQRRILLGTYALSSGYYDAYYKHAKRVQARLSAQYEELLNKVDVLAMPTTPTPAFAFGERERNPVDMYLADIFTVTANLVGAPAISVPCGRVRGLPVGLQVMGPKGADTAVLQVAAAYERLA